MATARPLIAALPAPLVGAVRGADVEGVTTPVPDECGAVPVADKVLLWIGYGTDLWSVLTKFIPTRETNTYQVVVHALLEPEVTVRCPECGGTIEVEMGTIGAVVEGTTLETGDECSSEEWVAETGEDSGGEGLVGETAVTGGPTGCRYASVGQSFRENGEMHSPSLKEP